MNRIVELIKQDQFRLFALECVYSLNLPQGYLAAGFVRNLVWDHLHCKQASTALNDLDVIYFDPNENDANAFLEHEARLNAMAPEFNWQVRNQARMHERNNDKPYVSAIDAMSYWPEKETAIAIRKLDDGNYECVSAFGFESLFCLQVTYNPKRQLNVFNNRVKSKNWLVQWPQLRVVT